MQFKEYYIKEKFLKSVPFMGQVLEIYENPTTSEIRDVIRDSKFKTIRGGLTDSKKPTLYIWDGSFATHHHILDKKLAKFEFGIQTSNVQMTKLESDWGADWNNFKNQKAVINKIKKSFPKAKTLSVWDHVITIDIPLK